MANGVDPRLLFGSDTSSIGQTFQNLLGNVQQFQNLQDAPLRRQLLQSQVEQQQVASDLARFESVAQGATEILPDLESDNPEAALQKLQLRRERLIQQGRPTQDTDQAIQMLSTPEGQLQLTEDARNVVNRATQQGLLGRTQPQLTAEQRNRQELLRIAEDQQASDVQRRAALIELGIEPRAVGSALQTISETGQAEQIAETSEIIKQREEFGKKTGASRAKSIDTGFERIGKIDQNIRNIDRAIGAIDRGASTGVIESRFFPNIRAATRELNQVRNELALDVIGSVTFGALSEGELRLAQDTALDTGLEPDALKDFLQRKRSAQEKLRGYFQQQIDFLDQGGTVAGFLREQRRQQGASNQTTDQQANETGTTTNQETTQQQFQEGQTAINPQTRERIIFRNGQWVPING